MAQTAACSRPPRFLLFAHHESESSWLGGSSIRSSTPGNRLDRATWQATEHPPPYTTLTLTCFGGKSGTPQPMGSVPRDTDPTRRTSSECLLITAVLSPDVNPGNFAPTATCPNPMSPALPMPHTHKPLGRENKHHLPVSPIGSSASRQRMPTLGPQAPTAQGTQP